MDTSEQYIKMCGGSWELQKRMFELPVAMNAGDFIWDGKQVFVLGQDFIGLEKVYSGNRVPLLYVAMTRRGSLLYTIDEISEPNLSIAFEKCEYEVMTLGNPCWLLRQDQLQKMIMAKGWSNFALNRLSSVVQLMTEEKVGYYWKFRSMEQLWLVFVMKEKYGKVWDGNNWSP